MESQPPPVVGDQTFEYSFETGEFLFVRSAGSAFGSKVTLKGAPENDSHIVGLTERFIDIGGGGGVVEQFRRRFKRFIEPFEDFGFAVSANANTAKAKTLAPR
jgi:hypothetical protein